jgi:hypothetical protein
MQVQEKKQKKQYENMSNDIYMKKWMEMVEEDAKKRKQEEEQGKKKKLEVKDFLLMQMGAVPTNIQNTTDDSGFINLPSAGPKKPGKAMNIEELRINKQLLKEINMKKKEK